MPEASFINQKYFYEDPTEALDLTVANQIIDFITAENKWTVIVSSKINTGKKDAPENY